MGLEEGRGGCQLPIHGGFPSSAGGSRGRADLGGSSPFCNGAWTRDRGAPSLPPSPCQRFWAPQAPSSL